MDERISFCFVFCESTYILRSRCPSKRPSSIPLDCFFFLFFSVKASKYTTRTQPVPVKTNKFCKKRSWSRLLLCVANPVCTQRATSTQPDMLPFHDRVNKLQSVPFWGITSQFPSYLSLKRDCSFFPTGVEGKSGGKSWLFYLCWKMGRLQHRSLHNSWGGS